MVTTTKPKPVTGDSLIDRLTVKEMRNILVEAGVGVQPKLSRAQICRLMKKWKLPKTVEKQVKQVKRKSCTRRSRRRSECRTSRPRCGDSRTVVRPLQIFTHCAEGVHRARAPPTATKSTQSNQSNQFNHNQSNHVDAPKPDTRTLNTQTDVNVTNEAAAENQTEQELNGLQRRIDLLQRRQLLEAIQQLSSDLRQVVAAGQASDQNSNVFTRLSEAYQKLQNISSRFPVS